CGLPRRPASRARTRDGSGSRGGGKDSYPRNRLHATYFHFLRGRTALECVEIKHVVETGATDSPGPCVGVFAPAEASAPSTTGATAEPAAAPATEPDAE
ncbi:MAG: hypothetical protein KKD00_06925, partial [Gammaproteobacteria bacterium]|nr:hypothetical protein [Gammaproteobacteria bacterium]